MLFFFSARRVSSASSGLSSTNKITLLSTVDPPLCRLRKREVKGRAFVDFAFRPNSTAVTTDNALDRGESDAGAFELGHVMQALKHAEQFARVGHIEAGAVVTDEIHRRAVVRVDAKLDLSVGAFSGEFPSVTQ